eukprot:Lankesteria_metandrocarpae@DN9175_c0_g1_i1.p1
MSYTTTPTFGDGMPSPLQDDVSEKHQTVHQHPTASLKAAQTSAVEHPLPTKTVEAIQHPPAVTTTTTQPTGLEPLYCQHSSAPQNALFGTGQSTVRTTWDSPVIAVQQQEELSSYSAASSALLQNPPKKQHVLAHIPAHV